VVAAGDKLTLRLLIGMVMDLTLSCTAHNSPSNAEAALANMAKDLVIPDGG
jgi:hypothetical protein